jgi:hypothetical protein
VNAIHLPCTQMASSQLSGLCMWSFLARRKPGRMMEWKPRTKREGRGRRNAVKTYGWMTIIMVSM